MKDGVLVIDKPAGMTSFDVLRRLRRVFGTRRLGHAGTLDPMATGVLVVAVNRATRLVPWLMAGTKVYEAEILLGLRTTTDDVEGAVISRSPVPELAAEVVQEALGRFTGDILQVPPQVSALHVDGERAHARVRRGERLDLPARAVTVHALELLAADGECLRLRCTVGKGTYIRALARDLGEVWGCGGTLKALRRLRCEPFGLEHAVPLEALHGETPDTAATPPALMSMWDALPALPCVRGITLAEAVALSSGQRVEVASDRLGPPGPAADDPAALYRVPRPDGGLLCLAAAAPTDLPAASPQVVLHARRVFARPEELSSGGQGAP